MTTPTTMPSATAEFTPPRLVTVPREQYLRKTELQIRESALDAHLSDRKVDIHLNAVLAADDLVDIHEAIAERQDKQGGDRVADAHRQLAASAWQLKLFHLDALANLVL